MADPRVLYPVGGIVTAADGTLASGFSVTAINVTSKERNSSGLPERVSFSVTQSDGSYSVDFSDPRFTTDYANSDKTLVCVYKSNQACWIRHTINTIQEPPTLSRNAHWGKPILSDARLSAAVFSNKHDTNENYVELRDVNTDEPVLAQTDILSDSTVPIDFGITGLPFKGGIVIVRETDTLDEVDVTLVVR